MSQNKSDAQKHFSAGRGLLAAAENLSYNMSHQHQRSARQMDAQDGSVSQMSQQQRPSGTGSHLSNTMKLFATLGLSSSDLDALADIPEEDISVETLPRILMQLKSRKADRGSGGGGGMSGMDNWDSGSSMGRMGGPSSSNSMGQSSARSNQQQSSDFGSGPLQQQDFNPRGGSGGGFLGYSSGVGGVGGSRDRQSYSDLSHHDSYGGGLGMGPSVSNAAGGGEDLFMARRMGCPSNGKVQDFLGVAPHMFPHVCSLCDFDVHSTMDWNQHTNGLRHAEKRRQLLDMYPEWDPSMSSGRSGSQLETPNLSAGLLGPAPMSSSQGGGGGMASNWGGGAGVSGRNQDGQNQLRGRVVVVKYDRKPLSNKTLFAFTEPFGRLVEHLVLKNKAFFEMASHEQAMDMVNFYEQQPACLYGKRIHFYLSKRLLVIKKDDRPSNRPSPLDEPEPEAKPDDRKVVFFSNLPKEEEKKRELLTIAERFGVVEKHLFLTDQAFVQLGTPEDAEMLVKYYSVNPLNIKGRTIRLNICTKYKTLNVNRRMRDVGRQRNPSASISNPRRESTSKSSSRGREERKKEERKKEEKTERAKTEDKPKDKPERVKPEKPKDKPERVKPEEKPKDKAKPCEDSADAGGDVLMVSALTEGGEEGGEEERDEQSHSGGEEETEQEPLKDTEDAAQQEDKAPGADDVTDDTPADVGVAGGDDITKGEEPKEAAAENTNEQETHTETAEGETADDTLFDADFLENMEDFVTLDELEEEEETEGETEAIDNSRKGGLRVVNIIGFRRGYNFMNELLGLAKPFGKVTKHLVLDLRPEAYLQFHTEAEARAMANFYGHGNVAASVCGRPVRVIHSTTYPTIQCGASKVVYIGQIPNSKYTEEELLKLAEPFGRVKTYFLNRHKRECFLEMEEAAAAESMAQDSKDNPPKFYGKRLTVYVSRKYRQLKHGRKVPVSSKRENSSKEAEEEPSAKKHKEPETNEEEKEQEVDVTQEITQEQMEVKEEEVEMLCDIKTEEEENSAQTENQAPDENQTNSQQLPAPCPSSLQQSDAAQPLDERETPSTNQNGESEEAPPPTEIKPIAASLPLPPHDPETPIGVEHVKMGYYCRVCFLFYSNEETAKKQHCSSKTHYDKLQKHLEKEAAKAEKKKSKKTSA